MNWKSNSSSSSRPQTSLRTSIPRRSTKCRTTLCGPSRNGPCCRSTRDTSPVRRGGPNRSCRLRPDRPPYRPGRGCPLPCPGVRPFRRSTTRRSPGTTSWVFRPVDGARDVRSKLRNRLRNNQGLEHFRIEGSFWVVVLILFFKLRFSASGTDSFMFQNYTQKLILKIPVGFWLVSKLSFSLWFGSDPSITTREFDLVVIFVRTTIAQVMHYKITK